MIVNNFIARFIVGIADKLNKEFNVMGIAIWPFIFIWPPEIVDDKILIAHEQKHIEQWKRYWIVGFLFVYFWNHFKHGYFNNPLEIEARAYANSKI